MDGWMAEFNVTFTWVRPNRHAEILILRDYCEITEAVLSSPGQAVRVSELWP